MFWLIAYKVKGNTWVLTWLMAQTKTAGGARVRSNFLWMAIPSSQPLLVPVPKIISADHTILRHVKRTPDGSETRAYTEFTGPYTGLPQVIKGDGLYNVAQRFGLYRWHIADPIRFEKKFKSDHTGIGLALRWQVFTFTG
jgi:hypothetical protein